MPIKAKWMPFTKLVIEGLPMNESGVYEVGKGIGNVVLYIGKSETSIRSRLLTHKEKTKFRGCTHFRFRRRDPDLVRRAEEILLEDYRKKHDKYPPLNKNKAPGDPYEDYLF
jgi:hypothetical protein